MATNRQLRRALLERLKVTPQRLSQKVQMIKTKHGPMPTEDATYVIAHQVGIDLTKYLDRATVDRVRGLVPRAAPISEPVRAKKRMGNIGKTVAVRITGDVPKIDLLLSTTLADEAKRMAGIYPSYYMLENSVRVVIRRVMEKVHGPQWWQTKVPKAQQDRATNRISKEKQQPWHGKRGQHEIFYSDFGDLKRIIEVNWTDFRKIFPSSAWITQKLEELESPRNVMAHHNPVSIQDEKRIDLYFKDWIALLQGRKSAIP
jgi:hypothetical protein